MLSGGAPPLKVSYSEFLKGSCAAPPLKVYHLGVGVGAVAAVIAPPLLAAQGVEQSLDLPALLGWGQLLGPHGLLVYFPLVLGVGGRRRHSLLLLLLLLQLLLHG